MPLQDQGGPAGDQYLRPRNHTVREKRVLEADRQVGSTWEGTVHRVGPAPIPWRIWKPKEDGCYRELPVNQKNDRKVTCNTSGFLVLSSTWTPLRSGSLRPEPAAAKNNAKQMGTHLVAKLVLESITVSLRFRNLV